MAHSNELAGSMFIEGQALYPLQEKGFSSLSKHRGKHHPLSLYDWIFASFFILSFKVMAGNG
ncbi:hypothetical protein [Peribacillus sp. SI8-4]|uniref:hypothetical protein n=1 Tax=Peribacillus sp. SI8-4 TaxID=3048009 RepID=UPI00255775E1|nr:hypothetical protein [Peribacillus sp. SI8-4]